MSNTVDHMFFSEHVVYLVIYDSGWVSPRAIVSSYKENIRPSNSESITVCPTLLVLRNSLCFNGRERNVSKQKWNLRQGSVGRCLFVLVPGVHPTPYTSHPTPYILHPTPCTRHPSNSGQRVASQRAHAVVLLRGGHVTHCSTSCALSYRKPYG